MEFSAGPNGTSGTACNYNALYFPLQIPTGELSRVLHLFQLAMLSAMQKHSLIFKERIHLNVTGIQPTNQGAPLKLIFTVSQER